MVLRLVAVALFDLPQTVILPGQHMVRIGFQRAFVPDLRELVVAEFAIGIADYIGHIRVIVPAERLQLLDCSGIVLAVVDRCIGHAITLSKCGVVDAGLPTGLSGLVAMGGFGARSSRRRFTDSTDATASSSRRKGRSKRGRSNQRHRKRCQRRKPDDHPVSHATLLHSRAWSPRSRQNCLPRLASNIPRKFSAKRDST